MVHLIYSALLTAVVQRSEPHCPAQYRALLTAVVQRSEPDSLPCTIESVTYCHYSVFRAWLTAPHNTERYLLPLFNVQSLTHCPTQYSALLTPAVVQHSEPDSLPRTIQCATYSCCSVFRARFTAFSISNLGFLLRILSRMSMFDFLSCTAVGGADLLFLLFGSRAPTFFARFSFGRLPWNLPKEAVEALATETACPICGDININIPFQRAKHQDRSTIYNLNANMVSLFYLTTASCHFLAYHINRAHSAE